MDSDLPDLIVGDWWAAGCLRYSGGSTIPELSVVLAE
jgi:hypothetical protein